MTRSSRLSCALATIALALVSNAIALAFGAERQSSAAECELLSDVRDGALDHYDLIDAALIASGVTEQAERDRWLRVRDARYAAIALPSIAQLPPAQRPPAILAGLHREILAGRFRPTASLLHDTLATGDFNCVTATILFHDLCNRCGVPAEIIAQSGHVCSRLRDATKTEVETTRRDWFTRLPGEIARNGVLTAEPVRRVITPPELLGRIYYNRALAALEQRQFETAVELLEKSLDCDPRDRDAQENLLAGLNNWALALCEAGEHAAAAQRIAIGLARNGDYGPLRSNDLHVHQQWVARLCRQGDFAEALAVLEAGRARRPEAPLFAHGDRAVYDAWLRHCVKHGDTATAAKVFRQAQQDLGPKAKLTVEAQPKPKVIPAYSRSKRATTLSGGE